MKHTCMFFLSVVCLLTSCNSQPQSFATVQDGFEYISEQEHGFIRDTLLPDEIKVSVQLIPSVLIKKVNTPGKQKYFSIQFSYKGNELLSQLPREEYGSYVQLFSFGMDRRISLLNKRGKEIYPALVSYQPAYNSGRASELLAVFDEDLPVDQDYQLIIQEFGLKIGRLSFPVDGTLLAYTPIIDQF